MKLLMITQAIDPTHPVLGFFVEWINAFRRHPSVEQVHTIATNASGSRLGRLIQFWKAVAADHSDAVLVHMTPLWLILGWPIWTVRRTKMALWYTHGSNSFALRIAVHLSTVTFTATEKAFPFTHPRVVAVGHGIAPSFAAFPRPTRPANRFALLSVGRIAPRKRVRETLALFAQIYRIEPRATLTWIGPFQGDNDPYAIKVLEDIERLKLKDAVHIGKSLTAEEIPKAYASHDLLLHLSDTGSLDKVVVEALATGCPVFSTNPATEDALGEEWDWSGRLNTAAAERALARLLQGVAPDERQRIAAQFALDALIERLVHRFTT